MFIKSIDIHRFRNINEIALDFSKEINFIFGDNAQGKTNLIETIYILCLAKSFRTRDESELVPFGGQDYAFDGIFVDDVSVSSRVAIQFSAELGKKIKVDGKNISQYSSLVGKFPLVILSSEDHIITTGPPAQRRKFFNILLSQSSSLYLDELKKYERILKQKNMILAQLSMGKPAQRDQLDIWNTQLLSTGIHLMTARARMVKEMNEYLQESYNVLTRNGYHLTVTYQPDVNYDDEDKIHYNFEVMLKNAFYKEQKRGLSLVGPHRDEFVISISGNELRRFGSRGEHKSALVSLKAAEAEFLKMKTGTNPILLLDDLYSELDINRGKSVMELFTKYSQTFITGTSMDFEGVKKIGLENKENMTFFVNAGSVSRSI